MRRARVSLFHARHPGERAHGRHPGESRDQLLALLARSELVARFRPPRRRPSHFSLLVQREVTKRNTPRRRARRTSLSSGTVRRCRGFPTVRPCTAENARASCPRPCGPDRHRLTRASGAPGSRARAPARKSQARAKQVQGEEQQKQLVLWLRLLLLARTTRAALGAPEAR